LLTSIAFDFDFQFLVYVSYRFYNTQPLAPLPLLRSSPATFFITTLRGAQQLR